MAAGTFNDKYNSSILELKLTNSNSSDDTVVVQLREFTGDLYIHVAANKA